MNRTTTPRMLWISLVFILLMTIALPVGAQGDKTRTLTISEADLNAAAQAIWASQDTPFDDISLSLMEEEGIFYAVGTTPRDETFSIEAVIVPSVVENRLHWTLASLETTDANGVISPRDPASGQATGARNRIIDVWEHAYYGALANSLLPYIEQDNLFRLRSLHVHSFVMAEGAITVEFSEPSVESLEAPDTPSLDDAATTTSQIIVTEQQANDALAAIARRHERIESYTVDFTPQGVKIEMTVLTPRGETRGIIAILIGLVVKPEQGPSYLQWTMTDVLISGVAAGDVNTDGVSELALNTWSRFVEIQSVSLGRENSIEAFQTTNETMIIAILIG